MLSKLLENQQRSAAYAAIIEELLRLTTLHCLTISDVAQRTGYDRTYIYRILRAEKTPSFDMLNSWAKLFGRQCMIITTEKNFAAGVVTECGAAAAFERDEKRRAAPQP